MTAPAREDLGPGEGGAAGETHDDGPAGQPERARADAPRPIPLPMRIDIRSVMLTGLFFLALFYTLYVARAFVVPLIVALLLSFLFSPLVRRLRRARVPEGVSAAGILLVLVGTAGAGLYTLSGPAAGWLAQAPAAAKQVETKVRRYLRPVQRFSQTAEQVGEITDVDGDRQALKVEIQQRSVAEVLFGGTQNVLGGALIVSVLLYFLLASGDLFLTKIIRVLPRLSDKKRAVQIARETEDQISSYLVAVTLVNLGFGVAVGAAMQALGMPNPVLWGALAAITNFVPYVGALVMAGILGFVALISFETPGQALLVPAAFLLLNILEGYVVTPKIVGRRLSLNPVVVFTGVLFWGWIWGVIGSLLAVPILAVLKILCDHIQGLGPVGEFLGD